MNLNSFKFSQYSFIGFYVISVIFMYMTYQYQISHPPCCDAVVYMDIAKFHIENDLFTKFPWAELRLYGFSSILAFFFYVFGYENAIIFYTIFICISYIVLSILIVNQLKVYVKNNNMLHIAFALNVFLFPYLTVPLADGISVILWMILFYLILKIVSSENRKLLYILIFLYSYILGMSIMVRPSNINLILLIPMMFVLTYLTKKELNKILTLLVLLLGFFIAVLPQLYINFIFFQKISFLPVVELGSLQIKWGVECIKYATNLSGEGIPQLYYKNPFYLPIDKIGLSWYFTNIENGIKTVFLHIFNVFTYDNYFPYIYDLYPKYKNLTLVYSWFILYFGAIGTINTIVTLYKNENHSKDIKIVFFVFFPIIMLSSISILAISAVETRFSLPLITILLPFAFLTFPKYWKNFKIISLFLCWLIVAFTLNSFVDLQKNIPYFQGGM